jgi:hypothetical protein
MKKFAILIAAVAIIGFFSSESFGQYYHGGHGYRGGGSAFAISVGNGFGNGFTYAQGPRGNNFYGVSINGGRGYGYGGGFAPVYARPVYRPVYPVYGHGGGFYGGGFYGGGYGRRCGW